MGVGIVRGDLGRDRARIEPENNIASYTCKLHVEKFD